jgi:hypothetical protein
VREFKRTHELAFIVGVLFVFVALPSLPHIPLCPIYALTKNQCPTCGTTRSFWFLMHGQFSAAWTMNPVGFVVLVILVRRIALLSFDSEALRKTLDNPLVNVVLLSLFFLLGYLNFCRNL